jgi:hypothetical protein
LTLSQIPQIEKEMKKHRKRSRGSSMTEKIFSVG